jgi:hypothetical protein
MLTSFVGLSSSAITSCVDAGIDVSDVRDNDDRTCT